MTGAEIGAAASLAASAGKEVAKVAKHAGEEARSDRQAVREAAKGTPGIEKAGELYGRRLATIQAIVNKLWTPIAWAFGESEYLRDDFNSDLAEKLVDIPEDELVSPKPTVAVPLVQALSYSHDEADLKEMYLNLLAAASTSGRAGLVHPSFVEVVKQLSAEECPLLNKILDSPMLPLVDIRIKYTKGGGYTTVVRHVINLIGASGPVVEPNLSVWLENWQRLGLVDITFAERRNGEQAYDWVKGRPEWISAEQNVSRVPMEFRGDGLDMGKGLLKVTARGQAFYSAIGRPESTNLSESLRLSRNSVSI